MTNIIFDIRHEYYLMIFRPQCLTITQTIILSMKLFANIFALALIITAPIALMFCIAYLIDGYK